MHGDAWVAETGGERELPCTETGSSAQRDVPFVHVCTGGQDVLAAASAVGDRDSYCASVGVCEGDDGVRSDGERGPGRHFDGLEVDESDWVGKSVGDDVGDGQDCRGGGPGPFDVFRADSVPVAGGQCGGWDGTAGDDVSGQYAPGGVCERNIEGWYLGDVREELGELLLNCFHVLTVRWCVPAHCSTLRLVHRWWGVGVPWRLCGRVVW